MEIRKDEFAVANQQAADRLRNTAIATNARYDRSTDRVVIGLSSGIEIAFRPRHAQGIEHAKPHQLAKIEITPSGLGIHFPKLDADISSTGPARGMIPAARGTSSSAMAPRAASARTARCRRGLCVRAM